MYEETHFGFLFFLTFELSAQNMNDAVKHTVIINFLYASWQRVPDVATNRMCYFAICGLKVKFFGKSELFGVYKIFASCWSFSLGLKLKLYRAALALKYILYSIKKHNMSFQNLIEQHKAN